MAELNRESETLAAASGTQMRRHIGFILQAFVLIFVMPLLVGIELLIHPHFLFLPAGLTAAAGLFCLGQFLRQS